MATFGKTLQRLREGKEMTREALGELCGLSRMQIFRLETEKQGASWETVQKLADALGVDCTAFKDADSVAAPAKRKKKGNGNK